MGGNRIGVAGWDGEAGVVSDPSSSTRGPERPTAELITALRNGDASGAASFDDAYREAIVRFCWGYLGRMDEAEDAAQEICFKVVSAGDEIPDHFRPWVYKIARNHCLNARRSRARRPDNQWATGASQICEALTGNLTRLAREEMQSQLVDIVRSLPEEIQEVLRLRYAEDLSRGEIAEVLDISETLVKTRLFDGLKKLRSLVQEIGEA